MTNQERKEVEFERLNLLGKAVFVTGTAFRMAGTVVESVVETLSGVVREAEKAFRSGMDPNVDEARILDEDRDSGKN